MFLLIRISISIFNKILAFIKINFNTIYEREIKTMKIKSFKKALSGNLSRKVFLIPIWQKKTLAIYL